MPSKRKFYRTVYTFEMLTEEPPESMSLESIAYETTEGHASGMFLETDTREVTGRDMAELLQSQGSDPEFFQLTEDGEDTEWA